MSDLSSLMPLLSQLGPLLSPLLSSLSGSAPTPQQQYHPAHTTPAPYQPYHTPPPYHTAQQPSYLTEDQEYAAAIAPQYGQPSSFLGLEDLQLGPLQPLMSLLGPEILRTVKTMDTQTGGVLTMVVVLGVLVFNFFSGSAGKGFLREVANIWQRRDWIGGLRGSRSMEPLTQVLDAIATSVQKWEPLEDPQHPSEKDLADARLAQQVMDLLAHAVRQWEEEETAEIQNLIPGVETRTSEEKKQKPSVVERTQEATVTLEGPVTTTVTLEGPVTTTVTPEGPVTTTVTPEGPVTKTSKDSDILSVLEAKVEQWEVEEHQETLQKEVQMTERPGRRRQGKLSKIWTSP